MEEVDFTDDEIYKELEGLGYKNIPPERFQQFKAELFNLITQERSLNSSSSSRTNLSHDATAPKSQLLATDSHSTYDTAPDVLSIRLNPSDKENFRNPPRIHYAEDSSSLRELQATNVRASARASKHQPQHVMKRKVLRKVDGQVSICESVTESEASDDLAGLQEQLRNTVLDSHRPKSAPPAASESHSSLRCSSEQRRPHTACREPAHYSLPENYHGPKALIRPMSCEPHVKHIKKSDPVMRYQSYQRCWSACRAPGEKAHKQLRWGVREKMLYHDQVVEKPQRSYQPNIYVIPSDKKRKTLRWQIRKDLAQGIKPPSAFD